MRIFLLSLLSLSIAAAEQTTTELRHVFTIPGGGWIRCNPGATIPVYECDPHALDEVSGRTDSFIVMPGGLAIFLSSGRSNFYYWQVSAALQAQFPDRHDLARLCGDGIPDTLARELNAEAKP